MVTLVETGEVKGGVGRDRESLARAEWRECDDGKGEAKEEHIRMSMKGSGRRWEVGIREYT